jgi:hypothetical protein
MTRGAARRGGRWAGLLVVLVTLQSRGCWCEASATERFNPVPPSGPATFRAFCDGWAERECAWLGWCRPAEHAGLEATGGCLVGASLRCQRRYALLSAAMAQGRATYDDRLGGACLAAWRQRGCVDDVPSACGQVLRGAAQVLDACAHDDECAAGLFCSGGPQTCGLCVPRSGPGGPCWSDGSCQEGSRCRDGQCIPASRAGQPCQPGEDLCDDGMVCGGQAPFTTCGLPGADGAPCDTWPCALGHGCVAAQGVCRPEAPTGGRCSPTSQEAPPCQAQGAWLHCDEESLACVTVLVSSQGGPCGGREVCASHLQCVTGRCAARSLAGDPCQGDDNCFESRCEAGTCVAPPVPGDPCQGGCAPLSCVGGLCASRPCASGTPWDAGVDAGGAGDGGGPRDGGGGRDVP